MWLMVLFDLPVVDPAERKAATRFRNGLLDLGFEMAQFSVYMRCCRSKEQLAALQRRVAEDLPHRGRVHMLAFTDRQFQNMVRIERGRNARKKPLGLKEQLLLF